MLICCTLYCFRDLKKIVDGIGAKYGRLISSLCSFVAAYIIGFIYIWKMSLIMTGMLPLMMIVGGVMAKVGWMIEWEGCISYRKIYRHESQPSGKQINS